MDSFATFVDVVLPLPLSACYTYRVPRGMEEALRLGIRVTVPFGPHKYYAAIVVKVHQDPPNAKMVKYVVSVLDSEPIIGELQWRFWSWMANYYLCLPGEVMAAALPSAFKLTSETKIVLNPDYDGVLDTLLPSEQAVAQALSLKPELTVAEIAQITGTAKTINLIKGLRDKEVVMVCEEVADRLKPKMETWIRLANAYQEEPALIALFDALEKRGQKQLEVLMLYVDLSRKEGSLNAYVRKSELLKPSPDRESSLQTLIRKGILETSQRQVSRLEVTAATSSVTDLCLSNEQQTVYNQIRELWNEKPVVLLHGVTSSGKTEIYIKLIQEALDRNQQILYLLPEIALTAQVIGRLTKYFGTQVAVYHSRFSEQERAEVWNRTLSAGANQCRILVGARSAIFLPFDRLGLVIVDEEHENTFKQFDPAPRYHARDAAIALAGMCHAKVLLGSATPSIESYFNAKAGKYGLCTLSVRYGGLLLPQVELANLKQEQQDGTLKGPFSLQLITAIDQALKRNEQVILFQNRRGFALRLECDQCHFMPECPNCDVTLTYHKRSNRLLCHYCGHSELLPEKCPQCGHTHLAMKGFGTEKVEDDLALIFPDAAIRRMDLDTTRSKHAYRQILSDFDDHAIDILIGTQMVTKGLDFEHVSLVGILNADNMLSYPDFRAYERSYQLMAQVSGRAGRKHTRGRVVIQTYRVNHPLLKQVIETDFTGMYEDQLRDRYEFHYPPFFRLIRVTLKHKDPDVLTQAATNLTKPLREAFGPCLLGPNFPIVSRIQTYYLREFLVKMDRKIGVQAQRQILIRELEIFAQQAAHKTIKIQIDVDPV